MASLRSLAQTRMTLYDLVVKKRIAISLVSATPLTILTFSTAVFRVFFSFLNNDKRINLYKSSLELSSADSLIDQWLQSKWRARPWARRRYKWPQTNEGAEERRRRFRRPISSAPPLLKSHVDVSYCLPTALERGQSTLHSRRPFVSYGAKTYRVAG